jgi:hypothetical protein
VKTAEEKRRKTKMASPACTLPPLWLVLASRTTGGVVAATTTLLARSPCCEVFAGSCRSASTVGVEDRRYTPPPPPPCSPCSPSTTLSLFSSVVVKYGLEGDSEESPTCTRYWKKSRVSS